MSSGVALRTKKAPAGRRTKYSRGYLLRRVSLLATARIIHTCLGYGKLFCGDIYYTIRKPPLRREISNSKGLRRATSPQDERLDLSAPYL